MVVYKKISKDIPSGWQCTKKDSDILNTSSFHLVFTYFHENTVMTQQTNPNSFKFKNIYFAQKANQKH